MGYSTSSVVRSRGGLTDPPWTDVVLQPYIDRASSFIDWATGWFFESRALVINIDGKGTSILLVPLPIIDITKIELIDWPGVPSGIGEVGLDTVAIYNRHLTENLTNPDDRKNPKISFLGVIEGMRRIATDIWPDGHQNVRLTGRFGFTEFDPNAARSIASDALDAITAPDAIKMELGAFTQEDVGRTITIAGSASNDGAYVIATVVDSKNVVVEEQTLTTEGTGFTATTSILPQWGVTPAMIADLCIRLVLLDLPPAPGVGSISPTDPAQYERMMRSRGKVKREKVRDQEIEYLPFGSASGGLGNEAGIITGDPQIDMLLLSFSRPSHMRTA